MISRFSHSMRTLLFLASAALISARAPGDEQFRRGDCNADGKVDVSDTVSLLNCQFSGKECSRCEDACDSNDDGQKDISDSVYALNFLFLGNRPPAAPFADCGTDLTPDRLGCEESHTSCTRPDPPQVDADAPDVPFDLLVRLLEPLPSVPAPRDGVDVILENQGSVPLTLGLSLIASGLDQRVARRQLNAASLKPGARLPVSISTRMFPMQSIGSTSQVFLEILVQEPGGKSGAIRSEPIFYDFDAGFSRAWVYSFSGAVGRFPRDSDAGLFDLVGRALDASGKMQDLRELQRLEKRDASHGTRLEVFVDDGSLSPPYLQPISGGVKVSAYWTAHYIDAGYGEDFLAPLSHLMTVVKVRAAFARAEVRAAGSNTLLWKGQLNSLGCTPILNLPQGSYVFRMSSILETPEGQEFQVTYLTLNPDYDLGTQLLLTLAAGFQVAAPSSSVQTKVLMPGLPVPVSNASAVVSHILSRPDHGIVPGNYEVKCDTYCPTLDGSSCASGAVYLRPALNGVAGDTEWKYVVAHEIGHMIQGRAMGLVDGEYDAVLDSSGFCRCDHVTGHNRLHCLQSREITGAAQVEGFAQFYAAKAFNDPSQSNCTFVYYKHFTTWVGDLIVNLHPPVPIDCFTPVAWRNNFCSHVAETGTEYDWMGFFLNVHQVLSMDDIYAIYLTTCSGSCNSDTVGWEELRQSAETYYGGASHPSYLHFIQAADAYGVDNQFD